MYTGITRGTYPITSVDRNRGLLTYVVELDADLSAGLEPGASISIDGVCQTVTAVSGASVEIDAIPETLDRSTLDDLEIGRRVSVERSARVGDEVGGHDIAGHVNGTGVVSASYRQDGETSLRIDVPLGWMDAIFEKGFIAVDGSSLTVSEIDRAADVGRFSIHLIPETLHRTNLGDKGVGDRLNIELDARTVAIVRTVERVLEAR